MKRLAVFIVLITLFVQGLCFAGYVNGYTKKDGTYVQGYYRSESNSTVRDNYSYKGNTNPYTGEVGKNKYKNNPTSEYYVRSPRFDIYKDNIPAQDAQNYNKLFSQGMKIQQDIEKSIQEKRIKKAW